MLLRKILAFFALSLFLPFYAYGTVCTLNNTQDGCISYDGCEYTAPVAMAGISASCTECQGGYYNSTSQNSTQCNLCSESSFPNTLLNGKEWDPDDLSTGNTECQWKCTTGWFVDNNHNSCITCPNNSTTPTSYSNNDDAHIGDCTCNDGNTYLIQTTENSTNSYYCGQCGAGVQPNTTGGVSTCTCPPTAVRVHGQMVGSYRLECACPTHGFWDNNTQQCQCNANYYINGNSCIQCPTHSFSSIGSDDISDCTCEAGYYMGGQNDDECKPCPEHGVCNYAGKTYLTANCASGYEKITDETNHTFECSSCSDSHAVLDDGVCKCDIGYYGTTNGLQTSCSKCPTGTITTAIGATYRTDCQMNSSTKFCYGSGNNKTCISLLPSGVTINASTTAPNNANNVAHNIAQ